MMTARPPGWRWRSELLRFVTAESDDLDPASPAEQSALRVKPDAAKALLIALVTAGSSIGAFVAGSPLAGAALLVLCVVATSRSSGWLLIQWRRFERVRA